MDQALTLRKLIQGEEGRVWAEERSKGWSAKSKDEVCEWDGIDCDGESVVSISLAETDLLATIPIELAQLSNLTSIDLRQNLIWGEIPAALATMPKLVNVILKENRLTGTTPVFTSQYLEQLDLSYNKLEGSIMPDFGQQCSSLRFLDLQGNQLTGYLPFGIEDLHMLETVSLSYNKFSGTLPEYLGRMSKLTFLYIDHNEWVGTIPSSIGVLGVNSSGVLQEIWLQNNRLSGTIPASLAESPSLHDLYVDGNKLTGSVPHALCKESMNADFFINVPASTKRNFCDSVTCPVDTVSDDGVFPCRNCSSVLPNPYLGNKGACDDLTEVRIVDMLLGKDVKPLSSACDYKGVTCNSDNKVTKIIAKGLGLGGTLPDELGLLEFLSELDVSDNLFTGYFPSGLRFAPLTSLLIGGNMIKGIVPPLMCKNAKFINGVGDDCTSIACPSGTFSKDGSGFGDCVPCPYGNIYLGSKQCTAPAQTPLPSESTGNTPVSTAVLFVIIVLFLAVGCVGAFVIFHLNRDRSKRINVWSERYTGESEAFNASLPHAEDLKINQRYRKRGQTHVVRDKGSSRTRSIQNHLSRSYHYIISLLETEPINDPPGVTPINVTGGEIDDFGWRERESILHDNVDTVVEGQKYSSKLEVWEYPDPLEKQSSHTGSFDEDDDDLSEWIRKQQSDPSTREVWLDVPQIE